MTREIDARVAREIDRKISEQLFGLYNGVPCKEHGPACRGHMFHLCEGCGRLGATAKPYSTDMNAAMEVVDSLGERGLYMKLHSPFAPKEGGKPGYSAWFASFDWHGCADGNPLYQGWADTPALAICLAAMEAVKTD